MFLLLANNQDERLPSTPHRGPTYAGKSLIIYMEIRVWFEFDLRSIDRYYSCFPREVIDGDTVMMVCSINATASPEAFVASHARPGTQRCWEDAGRGEPGCPGAWARRDPVHDRRQRGRRGRPEAGALDLPAQLQRGGGGAGPEMARRTLIQGNAFKHNLFPEIISRPGRSQGLLYKHRCN